MARSRQGGTRMVKQWSGTGAAHIQMTAAGTFGGGSTAFAASGTILRLFGEYILGPTSAVGVDDRALITVGVGIVSTDAASLGATAFPDPGDEPEYPWMYYASHALHYRDILADGQDGGIQGNVRASFDVGAMRKFKPRESLQVVVQYEDLFGTPPITFSSGIFRLLVAS